MSLRYPGALGGVGRRAVQAQIRDQDKEVEGGTKCQEKHRRAEGPLKGRWGQGRAVEKGQREVCELTGSYGDV